MKTKHEHKFVAGHFNKIATCDCGKWKYINLKAEDIMTEIPVQSRSKHTPTPCNCGELENLHIRSYEKYGTELVKCIPMTPDYFKTIDRAVNSHEALLKAAKEAFNLLNRGVENIGPVNGNAVKKLLERVIALAEGKGE